MPAHLDYYIVDIVVRNGLNPSPKPPDVIKYVKENINPALQPLWTEIKGAPFSYDIGSVGADIVRKITGKNVSFFRDSPQYGDSAATLLFRELLQPTPEEISKKWTTVVGVFDHLTSGHNQADKKYQQDRFSAWADGFKKALLNAVIQSGIQFKVPDLNYKPPGSGTPPNNPSPAPKKTTVTPTAPKKSTNPPPPPTPTPPKSTPKPPPKDTPTPPKPSTTPPTITPSEASNTLCYISRDLTSGKYYGVINGGPRIELKIKNNQQLMELEEFMHKIREENAKTKSLLKATKAEFNEMETELSSWKFLSNALHAIVSKEGFDVTLHSSSPVLNQRSSTFVFVKEMIAAYKKNFFDLNTSKSDRDAKAEIVRKRLAATSGAIPLASSQLPIAKPAGVTIDVLSPMIESNAFGITSISSMAFSRQS